MAGCDRDTLRDEILKILTDLREDWEYSEEITEQTGIFRDLEFESIDAVAMGSAIEEHFNQSLPFAEFLTKANERRAEDITVGEVLDFLVQHLTPTQESSL